MKLGKTTEKERYRRYEKIKEDCGKGRRRQKREFNNRNWWEGCKKINRRKRRRRESKEGGWSGRRERWKRMHIIIAD